ncbi:Replication factor C subunit 5, partial [Nibea albiflora]
TTTLHSPLQSTSMAYEKVTEDTVYTCTGHPLRSDIANILDWSLNKDFTAAYKLDFPPSIRIGLLIKLADIEHRLASGTDEKIQLSSMVAAFQSVRDLVVSEAS